MRPGGGGMWGRGEGQSGTFGGRGHDSSVVAGRHCGEDAMDGGLVHISRRTV